MPDFKVEYRLLGPGSFNEEAKDFRAGYAIERVKSESVVLGEFATREEARQYMIATSDERRERDGSHPTTAERRKGTQS